MTPSIQTKEQLLEALRRITKAVEDDDSFYGSIEFEAQEKGTFTVCAAWREGNSQGQGGMITIGQP